MTRGLVKLSLYTGIPFSALMREDDRIIATYMDLVNERARRGR